MSGFDERASFIDLVGWQKHCRRTYNHLSQEDHATLDEFTSRLSAATKANAPGSVNIVDFLNEHEIELNVLTERGQLVIVMFMEFFNYLEHVEHVSPKYDDLEYFLSKYEKFREYSQTTQEILMATANWISIILKFIPAKKNKGLIICVVPKYVEGLQTRYVTGSGQTHATNDRVYIYEVEGNVVRAHRHAPRRAKPGDAGYVSYDDDASVASGSVNSVPLALKPKDSKKNKKRSLKSDKKSLLNIDDRFNLDSDADILSHDGLSITAPSVTEERPPLCDDGYLSTPLGDDSPILKRTRMSRDITWGIDVNKKMHEEEDIFGLPLPHKSYHFAGETLVPADLCRSSSNGNLL